METVSIVIAIIFGFTVGYAVVSAIAAKVRWMKFFMGGERVVGTLSAYSTGVSLGQWDDMRVSAARNVRITPEWAKEGKGDPTDGFTSFEALQREILDIWKRDVASGALPHPNSWRARFNRFWLWLTRRAM